MDSKTFLNVATRKRIRFFVVWNETCYKWRQNLILQEEGRRMKYVALHEWDPFRLPFFT